MNIISEFCRTYFICHRRLAFGELICERVLSCLQFIRQQRLKIQNAHVSVFLLNCRHTGKEFGNIIKSTMRRFKLDSKNCFIATDGASLAKLQVELMTLIKR